MPVDASIYGQIAQPRQRNALADLAQAMQVQGMQNQNALAQYTIAKAQRDDEDNSALRADLSQPGADPYNALLRRGRVKEANDFAKGQADAEKTKKEGAKIDFDMGIKRAEHAASVLSLAKDQGSYDQVRQVLASQFGPASVAQMPPQFDPAYIQAEVAKGMTRAQQLADQRAKEGQAITVRGQDLTAETARRGQDITVRGQNLTDARAREGIANGKVPSGYRAKPDGTLEPIPGGPADPNASGTAKLTEDQGKATGWLVQAENAYKNMIGAIDPKAGGKPSAATPGPGDAVAAVPGLGGLGNWMRSDNRQKFVQGASSLSEALLRAATGAGVNKDEAKQKIQELTPQWGDGEDVIAQKTAAIPLYIESLKVRAGPGAPKATAITNAAAPAAGAPKVGFVQDGYRFKGGNPADPKSWEKM